MAVGIGYGGFTSVGKGQGHGAGGDFGEKVACSGFDGHTVVHEGHRAAIGSEAGDHVPKRLHGPIFVRFERVDHHYSFSLNFMLISSIIHVLVLSHNIKSR